MRHRDRLLGLCLLGLLVLMATGRWAVKAANAGGHPVFSMQTWASIWPWVLFLVAALAIVVVRYWDEEDRDGGGQ